MDKLHRRTFLAAGGTIAIAGCSSEESDDIDGDGSVDLGNDNGDSDDENVDSEEEPEDDDPTEDDTPTEERPESGYGIDYGTNYGV